jgi:hypothetical protein
LKTECRKSGDKDDDDDDDGDGDDSQHVVSPSS